MTPAGAARYLPSRGCRCQSADRSDSRGVCPCRRLRALSLVAASVAAANAFAHHGIANFDFNKDVAITRHRGEAHLRQPAFVAVRERRRRRTAARRSGGARCARRRCCAVRVGARRCSRRDRKSASRACPDRNEPNTCYLGTITFADGTSMDRYGQRQKAEPTAVAAESPRAAAERRSELERRLGRRATRHDGPPRHQRRARADQRRRHVGARAPCPRAAAHSRARAARRRRRPRTRFARRGRGRARCRSRKPGGAPPKASIRRRPTIRVCAASRRTSCSTGASRRSRTASRKTRTSIRIQYGAPGIDRTIHLNETAHPAAIEPSVAGHSIGRWENDVLDRRHRRLQARRAVGRHVDDAQRSAARRRAVLARSRSAWRCGASTSPTDPLYFTGEYRGADVGVPADLP